MNRHRNVCFWLASTIVASIVAGCAAGPRSANVSDGSGNSETVVVNDTGTYDQTIVCKSGKVIKHSGQWTDTNDVGMPGVPNDGSYYHFKDRYDLRSACSGNTSGEDSFEPKSTYTMSAADRSSQRANVVGGAIFLRISFFVFWLVMIVDVCRRDFRSVNVKVGWILCVVLLYCLGAVIYAFFGRQSGAMVNSSGDEQGQGGAE